MKKSALHIIGLSFVATSSLIFIPSQATALKCPKTNNLNECKKPLNTYHQFNASYDKDLDTDDINEEGTPPAQPNIEPTTIEPTTIESTTMESSPPTESETPAESPTTPGAAQEASTTWKKPSTVSGTIQEPGSTWKTPQQANTIKKTTN